MNKNIAHYKKRFFDYTFNVTRRQKIVSIIASSVLLVLVTTLVYASPGHDGPTVEVKQSDQVVVRKVGDTDPDAISQEGLSSFYGEIISKDIATIHPSRDGVITSWNKSVGDFVSSGDVLGYVTVTGISAEQQQQLALQQANALKAQLDLELAQKISVDSAKVFAQARDKYNLLAENQKQVYGNIKGINTVQGEIESLARNSFQEIYSHIGSASGSYTGSGSSSGGSSYFNGKTYLSIKYGLGIKKENDTWGYQSFIISYAKKISDGSVTIFDLQEFLRKTSEILSESYPQVTVESSATSLSQSDIDTALDLVKDYQTRTAEASVRYREQSLVGVDLQKNIVSFDTELDLKNLDQKNAQSKAENEAKVAKILAQKLATNIAGIVPLIASRSGIIATIEKNIGDYVTISDTIGLISNKNPQKFVRFTIPSSWKNITKGDTLSISWRPEFSGGSGTITGISPVVNEKGGYQAEALISKETEFPLGASVRIVPENSKKGVFIQHKAVQFEGVSPYVWIVTENNTIRKENITPGRGLGEYVEVLSGLERGFSYLVIMDPLVVLENGKSLSEIIKTETKKVDSGSTQKIQDESVPHSHDE